LQASAAFAKPPLINHRPNLSNSPCNTTYSCGLKLTAERVIIRNAKMTTPIIAIRRPPFSTPSSVDQSSSVIEMLFAHLKRILRLGRLRLRGPRGAQFEFTLAAIAQNLRKLAKLVARPPPLAAPCVV